MSDNSADALNTQEVAKNEAATVEPVATPAANHFLDLVTKVEEMLERLAAIEEAVSKFVPHLGPLAVIFPIADELAAIVDGLKRGRNNLGS